ncbi:MAG: phosphonate C-P lyase system protein PhnG, partial [Halanaerobiales bacterium]
MNRKRRTKVLIEGNFSLIKPIIDKIKEEEKIYTIEEPNTGLVMVKMRDSAKKQLFYLGEVLVTEAKVKIENSIGLGIVKGNNKGLAYDMAIIDALANNNFSKHEELKNRMIEM